jgi:hypothetical protein
MSRGALNVIGDKVNGSFVFDSMLQKIIYEFKSP